MSIFSSFRSQTGTLLTLTGPALVGAGALVAESKAEEALKKNYPPQKKPDYQPGQKVMHNGREYEVIGYSGHRGDTAHNLVLDGSREVWVTDDLSTAQKYARQGGEGSVATIIGLRSADTKCSRYENAYTAHVPNKDKHDYRVIKVDPVTPENDARVSACFSRMVQDLKSRFF